MEDYRLKRTENSARKHDGSRTYVSEALECATDNLASGHEKLDTKKASRLKFRLLKAPSLKIRCWQRAFTVTGTSLCFIAAFGSALDVWIGAHIQSSKTGSICSHQNNVKEMNYQVYQVLVLYRKATKIMAYVNHESVKVVLGSRSQSISDVSKENLSNTGSWINHCQSCTAQIILSMFIFTVATTGVYQLRRTDSQQNRYLFGGITAGIAVGLFWERDLQGIMLKVLPWTILLSLLFSILGHQVLHQGAGTRLPVYISNYVSQYEVSIKKIYEWSD